MTSNRARAMWTGLAVALIALAAIAISVPAQVDASGHAATRTIDVESVEPGGELTVTIEATNFGQYGKVSETLPEGWTFLSSDLPDEAVDVSDGPAGFILYNMENKATVSFTYTLRAPAALGVYAFEGVVADSGRDELAVGGDSEIAVRYTPWDDCLRGDLADGLSLVVYEGGDLAALAECAAGRSVTALYTLHEGGYVAYIPAAPDFLNEPFAALFAEGVPAFTPLLAAADAASDDPTGEVAAPAIWDRCLQGDLAAGFSLAVYAGGSVDDLLDCVGSRGVTGVHVLRDGAWLSWRSGVHERINRDFLRLFEDGVAPLTPLLLYGDDPLTAALETAARDLLARKLEADPRDLTLTSSERVEWSDASLGCPRDDAVYAQVLTPGYRLTFALDEASHTVHTNADGSHLEICANDEQPNE